MSEPRELAEGRRRLARAETDFDTEEGLVELQEGLGLLECVAVDAAAGAHRTVARNLGGAYASRIHERIKRQLESNRNLPEPELKHAFALVRAFDNTCFDVPPGARELKIELVRRLIDIYYEGYPPDEKESAYQELAEITGALAPRSEDPTERGSE